MFGWNKVCLVLPLVLASMGIVGTAHAQVVGDIQAFYNSSSNFGLGVLDGTVFVFDNTSGSDITNGVFSIGVGGDNATADSFNVGTIPAGGRVFVEPGISDDGGAGHTFFVHTGGIRDESDSGPSSDDVPFEFTGLQGGVAVNSGVFTPAATAGPSNDGTITKINFLGGGPQSDGPCNDCFGPMIVADLSLPGVTSVPEPACFALLIGLGLSSAGFVLSGRKNKK